MGLSSQIVGAGILIIVGRVARLLNCRILLELVVVGEEAEGAVDVEDKEEDEGDDQEGHHHGLGDAQSFLGFIFVGQDELNVGVRHDEGHDEGDGEDEGVEGEEDGKDKRCLGILSEGSNKAHNAWWKEKFDINCKAMKFHQSRH